MCQLKLQSQHLWFSHHLAARYFEQADQVVVALVSQGPHLLIAPAPAPVLVKLHPKASSRLLKRKNLQGDRTLSVHDFFIDHELPGHNKPLTFDYVEKLGALKVLL